MWTILKVFIEFVTVLLLVFFKLPFFFVWLFGHEACGILATQSGIEPTPPALKDEVLTTGPSGKSPRLLPSLKRQAGSLLPEAAGIVEKYSPLTFYPFLPLNTASWFLEMASPLSPFIPFWVFISYNLAYPWPRKPETQYQIRHQLIMWPSASYFTLLASVALSCKTKEVGLDASLWIWRKKRTVLQTFPSKNSTEERGIFVYY